MAEAKKGPGLEEERQPAYEATPRNDLFRRPAPRERIRLGAAGRFVIPASMRAALDVRPGDTLIAHVEDGELRVVSARTALRRVQEHMSRYKKSGESVVDEFIADRSAMWGEE